MIALSISNIHQCLPGSILHGDVESAFISSVAIDSRKVTNGALFVAIKGEHVDGHDYLLSAKENGAVAALVEKFVDVCLPQIVVENVVHAVGEIARLCRDGFQGCVLALTGSCGKTTTRDMLFSILSECGKVSVTKGNQNNELGVPLTIFDIENNAEFAVVEMGAAQKGDIAWLMHVVNPDITTITNIRNAHIGRFGNKQTLFDTKTEIFRYLHDRGKAAVNNDEEGVGVWDVLLGHKASLHYSLEGNQSDVYAKNIRLFSGRSEFEMVTPDETISVSLPVPGKHNVINAVCAAGMALLAGAAVQHVASGLESFTPSSSRLQILRGVWNGVLIDDSYNANVASFKAAIDVLSDYPGRKLLVMGDMAELGEYSIEMHAEVGRYAEDKGIDMLYACGEFSRYACDAFAQSHYFENKSDLVAELIPLLNEQDTVLVKGSRSAAMDEVVAVIKSGEQA